eukprot:g30230.t1
MDLGLPSRGEFVDRKGIVELQQECAMSKQPVEWCPGCGGKGFLCNLVPHPTGLSYWHEKCLNTRSVFVGFWGYMYPQNPTNTLFRYHIRGSAAMKLLTVPLELSKGKFLARDGRGPAPMQGLTERKEATKLVLLSDFKLTSMFVKRARDV